jgi:hypothetical protein
MSNQNIAALLLASLAAAVLAVASATAVTHGDVLLYRKAGSQAVQVGLVAF